MDNVKIVIFKTRSGKSPFLKWLDDLDYSARIIIRAKLERISVGNLGDIKSIKGSPGLFELRIFYGPGYRIYCAKKGSQVIIILAGGEKSSQTRDIAKAKRYRLECKD